MSEGFVHRAAAARTALERHGSGLDQSPQIRVLLDNARHARGARTVFRVEAGDPRHWMVLKVYAEPGRAQAQHDFLAALSARTDRVVAPVFVDAALGVVGTRFVGARTALAIVQDAGQRAALRAVAGWLDGYGADLGVEARRFDGTVAIDAILARVGQAPAIAATVRLAAERLRAAFARRAGTVVPQLEAFGDLKPGNLCLDAADRLVGIDGNPGVGTVPLARELSSLVHWSRMRRWRILLRDGAASGAPGGADAARRAAVDRADRDAVLGAMRAPPDPGLLELFCAESLLRDWIRLLRQGAAPQLREIIAADIAAAVTRAEGGMP
ncbi:hypothetical protein ROJ8625_01557 [Roseivivax jejudonensis]|uniref:Phosphotransferase enzyme family protein n=1 Tax=Roseivivax jejudonensis TaxID=1529041 RepID=A0A1X6YWE5_9RHOB|nr:hypothetical protein [Roseivivax jejudonensis]SLN33246.1 hypothetical protein ROJ8625_01557 [Roseivivax jejudonensis]